MSEVNNSQQRQKSKETKWIIIALCLISIPIILCAGGVVLFFYNIFLHEEPYNESHPESIINKIENNFDFKLNIKIESLKAADKIAGGIDRPYVFIGRFTTDKNGFDELRALFSGLGYWKDITDELFKKGNETIGYDPRYGSHFAKGTPQWYKMKIEKGKTYESILVSKNNKMRLHTICIERPEQEEFVVYIEGWGAYELGENDANDI